MGREWSEATGLSCKTMRPRTIDCCASFVAHTVPAFDASQMLLSSSLRGIFRTSHFVRHNQSLWGVLQSNDTHVAPHRN